MNMQTYAYETDSLGSIRARMTEADFGRPVGSILLDGVRGHRWLGPFDRAARDLLRVAGAVLAADRLSLRRTRGARGIHRDLQWQREIDLRVAVEDVARWQTAAARLEELLVFMTDDHWNLSFVPTGPVSVQPTLFPPEIRNVAEVALFSGGLDSVAGMYVRSQRSAGTIVAVSACGNDVRARAQADALECLRALGLRTSWVKLDHQLQRTHRSGRTMESSQRSRSFLFLAMGAVVASAIGLDTFQTYETGIGCLNLPLSSAQVGSQGTKAMHPCTLNAANELFAAVLDRPVRVTVPFFFATKGQLCRAAGSDLASLAAVAMSCDEGEGHKPDSMEHCGLCTSCVFRRVALSAAAAGPDPTTYRDVPSRDHGEYELRTFEQHARALALCTSFEDLVCLDPDVRHAANAPSDPPVSRDEAERRTLAIFRAYAKEISDFLSTSRPTLRPRPVNVRKENERDLFAAAG